ncbi:hypothetical protein [Eikenella sp. Marseille-P7795]|uniref:hypothetical protein n=1 Tax=Eikenella sp. Marseille-P7795 TaxID=2866577 RepID=UPI001CE40A9C|nr:hypothetical protein [Eikenella sp. Marseille-P7795]
MQGKPDWKKYRQQAAEKLRRLKQKPQLLAAAAIFSGSLLLAIGLLAGNGGKQQAPAPRPAPQPPHPPKRRQRAASPPYPPPLICYPEVADDHAIDDPLTAAEANPEPEHALPPATAQSMNPACESYFQRARACFRRAPEDQAEALLQSLEATRGDLAQLDAEGCEVVNRQFGEMVQQMGCEKTQAEAKPDEHKSPGASAPRAR